MQGNPWTVKLTLNMHPMIFKIDTEEDVTVIVEKDYNMEQDAPLNPSTKSKSTTVAWIAWIWPVYC